MKIVLYTEGLEFSGDTIEREALGGAETAFLCVARELARAGHEVTAYCLCPHEGVYDGVTYRHASRIEECERTECDLFLCSRYFFVFGRSLRARIKVLWMHDPLVPEMAAHLKSFLARIDICYCLSTFHRTEALRVLPQLAGKLRVTSNGIDFALVDGIAQTPPAKKQRIMYTSRPERGLWRALDAYERLDDRTLEFLICTYAPLPDSRVEEVEARCRARIADLVRRGFPITEGRFPKLDLYRHIAESKAVVYPTDCGEIFCISAIEAQACGTVFITTDAFAFQETVGYERVPLNDGEAFFGMLRRVLTDAAYRQDLEARGRLHARPFSWTHVAQRFLADAQELSVTARTEEAPVAIFDRIGKRPATAYRAVTIPATRRPPLPRTPGPPEYTPAVHTNGLHGLPKISCLCVTLGRVALLKRSIRSYCDQTYPNRELLIVTEGAPFYRQAIRHYVAILNRSDIRLLFLDPGEYTLGKVRNISLEAASGDLICQWDDDDCSHPERLSRQCRHLLEQKAQVSYLTDHLQYFERDRRLYWIDWTWEGRVGEEMQLAPGTLMMFPDRRFRYPESGPRASRGEDSSLLETIYASLPVAHLNGAGDLYLYAYHGRNTFSEVHHRDLRQRAHPAAYLQEHERRLRASLRYYPVPRPFTVCAQDAAVFAVNA